MLVNVTNEIMGRGGGGTHLNGGDPRNQSKLMNGSSSHINGHNNNHNKSASSFLRGDKASASVRIRSKKHEALLNGGSQQGQNVCKKRNRHSGDFSFFNHNSSSKNVNVVASKLSSTNLGDIADGDRSSSERDESQGAKDGGGDWAYITFPNGVPTVREIKTNGGVTNGVGTPTVLQHPDVTNVANGICKSQPIKVVTKNVPGVSIPFNNCHQDLSPSSPSTRFTDIKEVQNMYADKNEPPASVSTKTKANTPPSLSTQGNNNASILDPFSRQFRCMNASSKRMSADFTQLGRVIFNGNGSNINPYIQSPSREQSPFRIQQPGQRVVNENGVVLRNKPKNFNTPLMFNNNVRHSRIVEEQITGGQLRNQPPPPQYVTKVTLGQPSVERNQISSVTTNSQSTQMQRPNVLFRRKSEQPQPAGTAALLAGAAKRCSGEFDFVRNNRRNAGPDFTHYGFVNCNPMFRESSVSQPVTPSEPPSAVANGFSSMIYQPVPEQQEYAPVRVQVRSDSSPPQIRSENRSDVGGTSTFGSSKSSRSSSSHTGGSCTPSSRRRSSTSNHQHQISPLAAVTSNNDNASDYVGLVSYEEHANSPMVKAKTSKQQYEVLNIDIVPSSTTEAASAITPTTGGVKLRQPRQTGLGRRAVTQIHIQQKKKDSYNSAVCKSTDNLVKASLVCDEFEHVRASPRENQTNNILDSSFSTNGGFEDFESPNGVTAGASSSHDTSLEGERPSNGSGVRSSSTVRKGLLWQQRDKIFSQWKERYFILTPDYLQCFKKGTSRITEMGEFIFKIKLSEVDEVDILDKRGYLVVAITPSGREGKVYLRKTEGIRDWYQCLKDCVRDSKQRRSDRTSGAAGAHGAFWKNKQITDSSSIENWLRARKKIGLQYAYLDPSSKDVNTGDISIDLPTGTSRSQDDDSPNTAISSGKGLISGLRSGLSAASKKSARSEITLDELSDLYRSEAEEELREQEAAERRERLAVAAAANKRLFEQDSTIPDTVTVNGTGIENSSTKIISSKTPQNLQQSTCTVKTDTSSTSSSIQTKLGLANDDIRLRKPNGNGKKINRLSLMSDIELPDYGVQTDLSMDIEKGIFLRKKNSNLTDNESNDSGNNSMNTNGSVGSSNSSHSNSRGKEDRLETHIESEGPDEDGDNSPIPDSVKNKSTKIVVSNEHNHKSSNAKHIHNKKDAQTSSPLVSTSKTSSKALSPTGKIRDRSTDITSGNSSKNSSPRHAHGRRGSTDDQRRAGAIASLGGITSHNGSPVIKKSLQQSPTENNPRQRRAKSSQPSIASQQHQTQNNRRTHMPAGLQVTHV